MFFGTVPTACISQVFRVVDFNTWPSAHVCCSGTFRLERALYERVPHLPLHSNDVSLYSSGLGVLAAGGSMPLGFVDRLEFIEDFLPPDANYYDRVAALMVACDMAKYARKHLHARKQFDFYARNFGTFYEKARTKLDKLLPQMPLASYFCGDWLEHVDRAIEAGSGIAAFPPFFKGDYESQFKFIHENVDWPEPSYDLYDPPAATRDRRQGP